MGFSFASSNVGSSDLSWVRFRVGDTSSGSYRLDDEEINALVSEQGNKYIAAAICAEAIGAGFAQRVDKTVGKLQISMSQASERYFKLADRLRAEAGMRAEPYAGGISQSDKDSEEADTDRVSPNFTIAQFDAPGSGLSFLDPDEER